MSLDLASTDMSSSAGAAGQTANPGALSPVELLHLSELARSDAPLDRIQQQMIGAARRWVAADSVSLFVTDASGKPDEVHGSAWHCFPLFQMHCLEQHNNHEAMSGDALRMIIE
jgi:hypothetical protein